MVVMLCNSEGNEQLAQYRLTQKPQTYTETPCTHIRGELCALGAPPAAALLLRRACGILGRPAAAAGCGAVAVQVGVQRH